MEQQSPPVPHSFRLRRWSRPVFRPWQRPPPTPRAGSSGGTSGASRCRTLRPGVGDGARVCSASLMGSRTGHQPHQVRGCGYAAVFLRPPLGCVFFRARVFLDFDCAVTHPNTSVAVTHDRTPRAEARSNPCSAARSAACSAAVEAVLSPPRSLPLLLQGLPLPRPLLVVLVLALRMDGSCRMSMPW